VNALQAVVLGVVQGVTEFLPISSDGHLAVTYQLFHMQPDLTFEVFLHFATLIALVAYFWRDLLGLASSLLPANRTRTADRKTVLWIVVGTTITAVIALVLKPYIEAAASSPIWTGLGFLVTAGLLTLAEVLARRVRARSDASELGLPRSALLGLLQGMAVLPGVSRSGSTIAAGVMSGLDRETSARFSFLLGFPIITLAAAKDVYDLMQGSAHLPGLVPSAVGFIAALVSGYIAVWWLVPYLKNHRLWIFAAYTAVLGTVTMVVGIFSARG
jgi:undecaprenyl-diphosphatase